MNVTEEEAKTKWCPFVRAVGSQEGKVAAVNVVLVGEELTPDRSKATCVGAACMAWRWDKSEYEITGSVFSPKTPTKGYCGLAGRRE